MPQLALNDVERHPLVRQLDGVGVAQLVRGKPLSDAGPRGDAPQLRAGGVGSPRPATRAPLDHAQQRTDRHPDAQLEPGPEVIPAPAVHADLAPAAALTVAHEHGSGTRLEVVLREPERLVDAQSRPPQQHDQSPHPGALHAVAGLAHDRDDLLHRGRIGRVAQTLVARWAPGKIPGQGEPASGGGRRRSAAAVRTWTLLSVDTGRRELHGAGAQSASREGWPARRPPPLLHRGSSAGSAGQARSLVRPAREVP
jgi:hypothetical protein